MELRLNKPQINVDFYLSRTIESTQKYRRCKNNTAKGRNSRAKTAKVEMFGFIGN